MGQLSHSQLGYKFRRQTGFGHYIVDFYCPELRLIIELDGDSHYAPGAKEDDAERTQFLQQFGLHVVRYGNHDVIDNMDGVMSDLWQTVQRLKPASD